jgi:aspartyl-tRNA(Asn)/glutamyl-tRNA(Gln) amidotransferase subunit A
MSKQSAPPALSADAIHELARTAGHGPLTDELAQRIAAGAAAACAAVARFIARGLHDHEPGDFLLAQLDCAQPATDSDAATSVAPASAAHSPAAALPAASDPTDWSLCEAADAIRRRALSSEELVRATLARAQRVQPTLNCFLDIDSDAALAAARKRDLATARGEPVGALHGVPLAHKAMFDRAGVVTLRGARIHGPPADTDAHVIRLLQDAGSVNLGALNMSEFAFGPTGDNRHYGRARNAVDPEYMAGGSSSGSAVATAAHAAFGSLGSDTGGSIRIPAAANGVVGLKATYGLVSRRGAMKLSPSLDFVGPIARTVRDCARLLRVLADHDPRDTVSTARAIPDYEQTLGRGLEGLRIARVGNYFFDGATPDVHQACERSLAKLKAAGARIGEVAVPSPEPLAELSRVILYAEATALHGQWLRTAAADYSPQVRVRALTGLAIPASTYYEAQCLRGVLLREFIAQAFADCDLLLMPTLVIPVPRFADVDVGGGPAMWDTMARLVQNTAPFNYLGLPAISVPAGRTANGLPASVQLVARPFGESLLLRAAEIICDRAGSGSRP